MTNRPVPGALGGCRTPAGLVQCTVAVVACLAFGCDAPKGGQAASPRTIRVAYPSIPEIEDLPSLIAQKRLVAMGYRVEPTWYAQSELAVQAMAAGDADLAHGSSRTFWAAAGRGAGIVTLMRHTRLGWKLVSRVSGGNCAALEGRRVAVHSPGSVGAALLEAYRQQRCPHVALNPLILAGSANRVVALLAGEIDTTLLRLSDLLTLERHAPDRFHVVVDFEREWPMLIDDGLHASVAFVRTSPDAVVSYLQALLLTYRDLPRNPGLLIDEGRMRLRAEPAEFAQIAHTYVEADAWQQSGALTLTSIQYSLDFFATTRSLPPGLKAETIADLSFLERALKQLDSTDTRRGGHQ